MRLSIRQLAELAGVSRGTVDRALNNRPGINQDVRERILQLAREHGYRSNKAGRVLGLHKSPLRIGVQMPSEGNDFFLDVRRGIDQAASELSDYGLAVKLMTMKGFSASRQVEQAEALLASGIDGLAIVPIDRPPVQDLLDRLSARGIPVIAFNTDVTCGERLAYIGNDYVHSGRIAGGLLALIADGRPMKTLIMTGSTQILGHNQRIAGFMTVMHRHPQITVSDVVQTQDDDQLAMQQVGEAMQQDPGLQAIYMTAGGVAGACQALSGHCTAGTIKLICFDQTDSTRLYQESGYITASIGQEPFQQGYQAVRRLYDYLLDGTRPPSRILTRNEIIIREHVLTAEQDMQQRLED